MYEKVFKAESEYLLRTFCLYLQKSSKYLAYRSYYIYSVCTHVLLVNSSRTYNAFQDTNTPNDE